ncbi:MAG: cytochrome b/b6 domain-containing protein [Candidatus Obscuribacterales bacterium]|nr:cytochrome b/b6 domain-containing protein [Steroidobacteraceae bacterium]
MVKVWDWWVRIGHWLLVFCIAAAWITRHGGGAWHEWPGYGSLALIAIRILWGFIGSPHARFADFVHPPKAVVEYTKAVWQRREPHYVGHNPLGGYMAVALLLITALVSASGWLYTTDRYWGIEWVGRTHDLLADLLLILVATHIAGVLFACYRERENLVAAMFHGRKRVR